MQNQWILIKVNFEINRFWALLIFCHHFKFGISFILIIRLILIVRSKRLLQKVSSQLILRAKDINQNGNCWKKRDQWRSPSCQSL